MGVRSGSGTRRSARASRARTVQSGAVAAPGAGGRHQNWGIFIRHFWGVYARHSQVVVDGAPGLEKALAALWPDMAVQRCTVHKHRNLLAHAPERLHEEISNDYKDMIYAATKPEIEGRRKAFVRKWRLKCRAVADSLEEAGDKLFTFTRFPLSQWKSIRTSNAIERLHEEFKRRIKTQTVLPCAETAAMLFWALLASGQITMRKVDGWQTLAEKPDDQIIDLAA